MIVPRHCTALASREKPFVLILDDLHLVDNPDCMDPLIAIAQSVPHGSNSRSPVELSHGLSDGCVRTGYSRTRCHDLEMTAKEAAQTLDACGLELQSEAVTRLVEHTEGWPVGIYLAGLSLTRKDHVETAIRTFTAMTGWWLTT